MKKLPFIIFALLLIGCSDNGVGVEPEPGFEPYRVGDFVVTSQTTGEYSPEQSFRMATSADTTTLTVAGDQRFSVEYDTTAAYPLVEFTFRDSSITKNDSVDVELSNHKVLSDSDRLEADIKSFSYNYDYVQFGGHYIFRDNEIDPNIGDVVLIFDIKKNGNPYVTYRIEPDGMIEMINDFSLMND